MNYQSYLSPKSELYDYLYLFLIEESNSDKNYVKLIKLIDFQYKENSEEFKFVLHIINKISKNHRRSSFLFRRIEQIIVNYEEYIKSTFSNSELFNIFKSNRLLLILLFEKKIINLDDTILHLFTSIDSFFVYREYFIDSLDNRYLKRNKEYINRKMSHQFFKNIYYFYPEIKSYIDEDKISNVEKHLMKHDKNIFENFDINRKIGENEAYIGQLIRQDSIIEFIKYVNKTNTPLSSKINQSFFETNPFLFGKMPTLIEYAAFFGSIQIFKYLQLNNVDLSSSLWLYSIHGNNPEIIHLLEENDIIPDDESFLECYKESIKCHHNDIANYIRDNLLNNKNDEINIDNFIENEIAYSFRYYNFSNLYSCIKFNNFQFLYFYASKYDYLNIVKILVENEMIDVNYKVIID